MLCFLVGVNLIFYGEKLLIIGNFDIECDLVLFEWLGLCLMLVWVDVVDYDCLGMVYVGIIMFGGCGWVV